MLVSTEKDVNYEEGNHPQQRGWIKLVSAAAQSPTKALNPHNITFKTIALFCHFSVWP